MIAFSDTFLDACATETMIAVRIEMRICTVLKADRAFKFFTDKALERLQGGRQSCHGEERVRFIYKLLMVMRFGI